MTCPAVLPRAGSLEKETAREAVIRKARELISSDSNAANAQGIVFAVTLRLTELLPELNHMLFVKLVYPSKRDNQITDMIGHAINILSGTQEIDRNGNGAFSLIPSMSLSLRSYPLARYLSCGALQERSLPLAFYDLLVQMQAGMRGGFWFTGYYERNKIRMLSDQYAKSGNEFNDLYAKSVLGERDGDVWDEYRIYLSLWFQLVRQRFGKYRCSYAGGEFVSNVRLAKNVACVFGLITGLALLDYSRGNAETKTAATLLIIDGANVSSRIPRESLVDLFLMHWF